jgi:hypothetical protein
MFKKLCGDNAFKSVLLATSMCSKVIEQEIKDREKELIENDEFWGLMCKKGSRVFRYENTRDSALSLIKYIISLRRTVVLDIQDETVNNGCEIEQTSAAKELNVKILREKEKHKKELKEARSQMQETIAKQNEKSKKVREDLKKDLNNERSKHEREQQQYQEDIAKQTQNMSNAHRREMERLRSHYDTGQMSNNQTTSKAAEFDALQARKLEDQRRFNSAEGRRLDDQCRFDAIETRKLEDQRKFNAIDVQRNEERQKWDRIGEQHSRMKQEMDEKYNRRKWM